MDMMDWSKPEMVQVGVKLRGRRGWGRWNQNNRPIHSKAAALHINYDSCYWTHLHFCTPKSQAIQEYPRYHKNLTKTTIPDDMGLVMDIRWIQVWNNVWVFCLKINKKYAVWNICRIHYYKSADSESKMSKTAWSQSQWKMKLQRMSYKGAWKKQNADD